MPRGIPKKKRATVPTVKLNKKPPTKAMDKLVKQLTVKSETTFGAYLLRDLTIALRELTAAVRDLTSDPEPDLTSHSDQRPKPRRIGRRG